MSFLELIGFIVAALVALMLLIIVTRGWILLAVPAAAVILAGYAFAMVWYSPYFWEVTLGVAGLAALYRVGRRWPAAAVLIVALGLIAFGFYLNTPTQSGGTR